MFILACGLPFCILIHLPLFYSSYLKEETQNKQNNTAHLPAFPPKTHTILLKPQIVTNKAVFRRLHTKNALLICTVESLHVCFFSVVHESTPDGL